MPDLAAFRALRYDAAAVPDLSAVLCPPYDVISERQRDMLAAASRHNAVHLELPAAAAGEDGYEHAGRLFERWQAAGVLRLDQHPMVYVYEQRFRVAGGAGDPRRAIGFFCRLHLEQPGGDVRWHERTMSAPKEDRFRLLRAVRANLSPVLMLHQSDRADEVVGGPSVDADSLPKLDRISAHRPTAQATTPDGTTHRLWAVDPARVTEAAELLQLAGRGGLTIADGHHRYETALRYRDEGGGPGAEYVLALLYDAASGGLVVLPTHRLLRGVPETEALVAGVSELFHLDRLGDAVALEQALVEAGSGTIALWTRRGGALMRPRWEAIEPLLPEGSAALRRLDVVLLGAALETLIGVAAVKLDEQGRLGYTKDTGEAVAEVESGAADACFLLNATPVVDVLAVAEAGDVMPAKSTYFVPKAATGMLFNLLAA